MRTSGAAGTKYLMLRWVRILFDEVLEDGDVLLIIRGVALLLVELCTNVCCFKVDLLQLPTLKRLPED